MNFDSQFIAALKQQTDLQQLIEELCPNISWVHYSDILLGAVCPHPEHNDETPSFRLFKNENSWSCMRCHCGEKDTSPTKQSEKNFGSDCIAFVQWIKGYGYKQAVKFLAGRIHMPLPQEDPVMLRQMQENLRLTESFHAGLVPKAKDYLLSRGLTEESIYLWQLGWCVDRITFPLVNRYRQIIGFTRRILEDKEGESKYKNSKTSALFNKSEFMYGEHDIDKKHPYIYITEGPMDVILPRQFGLPNTVAPLGTAFTVGHAKFIKQTGLKPVIVMDGDEAGEKAMHKIAKRLQEEGLASNVIVLPIGMDLADLSADKTIGIKKALEMMTQPYSMHCLKEVLHQYESKVQEIKLALYPDVIAAASYIKDPQERALMNDLLYDKMRIKLH